MEGPLRCEPCAVHPREPFVFSRNCRTLGVPPADLGVTNPTYAQNSLASPNYLIFQVGGLRVSTTFDIHTEAFGQGEMELSEQGLLLRVRSADSTQTKGASVGGLQEDVTTLDPAEAVQGLLGREGRACPLERVLQRDPERIAQEGHQDVPSLSICVRH